MKIVNRFSVFFIFCVVFFSSCKNDLNLNAPYKEIPSIYAVLNPQDTVQMIRINKVFLGEGDANQMAQVADSINYPAGELSVTVTHSDDGETITFRDTMIQTVAGAFNRNQRVYYANKRIKTYGVYTLKVKNTRTGNEFTARTVTLDSINANSFSLFRRPYYTDIRDKIEPYNQTDILNNLGNPNYFVDYSSDPRKTTFRYPVNDAKIYQLVIRMHFYDTIPNVPVTAYNYADYTFVNQYVSSANISSGGGGLSLLVSFTPADFFTAMGVALKSKGLNINNVYGRKIYKAQFFIYSSTQDYLDYLQYATPSFNISQNKSLYSNFENEAAVGIFTVRTRSSVEKAVSTFFVNEFARNTNTKPYKFVLSDGTRP